jgi:methyl coenzyme M reductase subunit C
VPLVEPMEDWVVAELGFRVREGEPMKDRVVGAVVELGFGVREGAPLAEPMEDRVVGAVVELGFGVGG